MYKLATCGNSSVRKITLNGEVVASLLQYANDLWGIYDKNEERRLSHLSFGSPGAAKTHYVNMKKMEKGE